VLLGVVVGESVEVRVTLTLPEMEGVMLLVTVLERVIVVVRVKVALSVAVRDTVGDTVCVGDSVCVTSPWGRQSSRRKERVQAAGAMVTKKRERKVKQAGS